MGQITLQGVRKSFGPVNIIKDANLEIETAPSWCSSDLRLRQDHALRLIAG
jgi:ABC-type sugar transport systems, ATPase components